MSNTKSEIKNIIMDFSNENLNEEYTNKSLEILEIGRASCRERV